MLISIKVYRVLITNIFGSYASSDKCFGFRPFQTWVTWFYFYLIMLSVELCSLLPVVLNLTSISSKLLAESDDGGRFMVYNRWGRVGVKGQNNIQGPYTSRESAIREFEQKFFAKTKNDWSNRREFVSYPKCYTWLEMDYSENEKDETVSFLDSEFNSLIFLKAEILIKSWIIFSNYRTIYSFLVFLSIYLTSLGWSILVQG